MRRTSSGSWTRSTASGWSSRSGRSRGTASCDRSPRSARAGAAPAAAVRARRRGRGRSMDAPRLLPREPAEHLHRQAHPADARRRARARASSRACADGLGPSASPTDRSASPPVDFRAMAIELDYYEILGVDRGASDAEIKRAFRRLAQHWHPDVNKEPGADERFKEINEAYQVLSDPQRRQALRHVRRAGAAARSGDPFGGGFGGFGDIFDAFFGGNARRRTRRGPPAGRLGPALRPADHVRGGGPRDREGDRVPGPRPLRHVRRHGAKPGTEPITCPQCNGRGEVRGGPADDARPDGQRHDLPALPGRGPDRRDAVRDVQGRRPDRADADAPGDDPAGHRRGPPDPALERGRGGAARRAAGQPVRRGRTSRRTRRSGARAPSLSTSSTSRSRRPRSGRAITDPDGRGRGGRSRSRPGTQPGTEIRLRGKGVPHLRGRSVARRPPRPRRRRGPDQALARQRELLEELAAETASGRDDRRGRAPRASVRDAPELRRPGDEGRHEPRAPGSSSRSRRTSRRSRRSARS